MNHFNPRRPRGNLFYTYRQRDNAKLVKFERDQGPKFLRSTGLTGPRGLPLFSLSLLISPPLVRSLLSWNNCKTHLEKIQKSSSVHRSHDDVGLSVPSVRLQPLSHICNSFASIITRPSVGCVLYFSFLFCALKWERADRGSDRAALSASELELLVISDNGGAVPPWTRRTWRLCVRFTLSFWKWWLCNGVRAEASWGSRGFSFLRCASSWCRWMGWMSSPRTTGLSVTWSWPDPGQ